MLLDMVMSMMQDLIKEIKQANPEKRDHFIKSAITLTDLAAEALETSPEFRQGFAKVHSKFLQYPECQDTIKQSVAAYKNYIQ